MNCSFDSGPVHPCRYGPILGVTFVKLAFPKRQCTLDSLKPEPHVLPLTIAMAFTRNVLLAYFLTLLTIQSAHEVATLAFTLWFVASSFRLSNHMFEEKPWQLWALHAGHQAACLALNCVILGLYLLR